MSWSTQEYHESEGHYTSPLMCTSKSDVSIDTGGSTKVGYLVSWRVLYFFQALEKEELLRSAWTQNIQADWTLSATSLRISSGWITVATKNMSDAWSVQPFRYITHCVWCWLARLKSQAPSVQELYRTLLFILFCYWLLQSYDHMNLCTRKTRPWALPCANNQDTSLPQEALT